MRFITPLERLLERLICEQEVTNWLLFRLLKDEESYFPKRISFKEITMLSPVAGNTLVYTGTLSPAGASFPSDTQFTVVSSDPTVTPTVDATGLIVTIPLPSTFVDNPATPFNVVYTATSASTSGSITATITPSIPATFPTGIVFNQTT